MDNDNKNSTENTSNPESFNPVNPVKTKKKLGPVKGILLALLIVFLIGVIGLLIRMEVVGDGDYFAPFKKMFGIETKVDEEEETKVTKTSKKSSAKTTERLSLLSEDVNKRGVTHYSIKVDLADLVNVYIEQMQNISFTTDDDSWYYDDDEDDDSWYYDDDEDDDSWYYDEDEDDDSWYYDDDEDDDSWYYDDDEDDDSLYFDEDDDDNDIDYEEIMNCIAGSAIIDLYVKDNKIVQVVFGMDYMELIENLYDAGYTPVSGDDEEDGFASAEEYAEYVNSTLKLTITKSYIAQSILSGLENSDANVNITETEIKSMIDLVREPGLFELYFTPTSEMNEELINYIEENTDELEENDIDTDDIFASMIEYIQDELEDEGYEDLLEITVE